MSYYDALITAWDNASASSGAVLPSGVTGSLLADLTTSQKLTAINAWTVAGSAKDIPISEVAGYLLLNGITAKARAFLASPPSGTAQADLITAQSLLDLISTPTVSTIQTSNPAVATQVATLLGNLQAVGIISATDVTNLLALSSTSVPWWQVAGYTSAISANDLMAAGGLS